MIKPIQTEFRGHLFRSRLEARWAVFFHSLGLKYEYEREGFDLGKHGWYLPDFWLPHFSPSHNDGFTGVYIEIKPANASSHEFKKAYALGDKLGQNVFIFQGQPYETEYDVTQIQFWDLGRLEAPIVLKNLTFRPRITTFDLAEEPSLMPHTHECIQLGNGIEWAGGFVCSPFAYQLTKSQLDKAFLAARQARFEHRHKLT